MLAYRMSISSRDFIAMGGFSPVWRSNCIETRVNDVLRSWHRKSLQLYRMSFKCNHSIMWECGATEQYYYFTSYFPHIHAHTWCPETHARFSVIAARDCARLTRSRWAEQSRWKRDGKSARRRRNSSTVSSFFSLTLENIAFDLVFVIPTTNGN